MSCVTINLTMITMTTQAIASHEEGDFATQFLFSSEGKSSKRNHGSVLWFTEHVGDFVQGTSTPARMHRHTVESKREFSWKRNTSLPLSWPQGVSPVVEVGTCCCCCWTSGWRLRGHGPAAKAGTPERHVANYPETGFHIWKLWSGEGGGRWGGGGGGGNVMWNYYLCCCAALLSLDNWVYGQNTLFGAATSQLCWHCSFTEKLPHHEPIITAHVLYYGYF